MLRPQSIKPLSISTLHRRNENYPPSTVHCPPGSLPEGGLIGDVALFMSMSAPNVQQFNIGSSSSLQALADIDIPFKLKMDFNSLATNHWSKYSSKTNPVKENAHMKVTKCSTVSGKFTKNDYKLGGSEIKFALIWLYIIPI